MKTTRKILIVEHQQDDITLMEHELKNGGITFVSEVAESEEGFTNSLQTFLPDIILCDYTFPDFSGKEAFAIRNKIAPDTPFIFVSGSIGEELSVEYIKNGLTDYVLKDKLFSLGVKVNRALEEANEKKINKQIEKELRRREKQFSIAQSIAHIGSWQLDLTNYSLIFSEETCKIFGVPVDHNHLTLDEWRALVHPDDIEEVERKLMKSQETFADTSFDHRIIHKDGSIRYIHSESRFSVDVEGRHTEMFGIACDVTEKIEAEERLAATTNELQQAISDLNKIMDFSLDVICAVSADGKFIKVSAAAENVWGYKPSELIGKLIFDFIHPDDLEKTNVKANDVMAGEYVTHFENRYIHKNGTIVPISWSARWDEKDQVRYGVARDATERKRLEKALESERLRLKDLFYQAPTSMGMLKGKDFIFEMANPLYLALTGKKDIIGKPLAEAVPELVQQGALDILHSVYSTGESFSARESLFRFDQQGNGMLTDKYLDVMVQAYRDIENNIEGVFFFLIDVTEQVVSRKRIEESEKRYRQIVETAQEGICLLDADNKITFVNKEMCDMLEYPEEEIIGNTNFSFKDAGEQQQAVLLAEERKTGVKQKYESTFITRTGKKIFTQISTNPIFNEDGTYGGTLAMVTDITERKIAEGKIMDTAKRLQLATSTAGMGIWQWDIKNDTLVWDESMHSLYDVPLDEFDSVYNAWISRLHPEDIIKTDNDLKMAIAGEKEYDTEFRIIWRDGSVRNIRARAMIEKDKNGEPIRMIGANWDSTERRLAEFNLKELNNNLQKQAKELALSNAELEQFAYVASHDLQEPLRMVSSFLTLLDKKYSSIIDEKGKKYIDFAVDGANRMRNIILDLLEFSRVGKMDKTPEEVNINKLIEDIKKLYQKQITEKKATIQVNNLPLIKGYKAPLMQVFQNLVGNGLKYTKPNVKVEIIISAIDNGSEWKFTVADNGIGIEETYFEKIFVIFQRLHSNAEFSGTGIGLAITKKIIENMHGKIWVESAEGQGSTFHFTLPKTIDEGINSI